MPLQTAPAERYARWLADAQTRRRARRAAWEAAGGNRARYAEIMSRRRSARTPAA